MHVHIWYRIKDSMGEKTKQHSTISLQRIQSWTLGKEITMMSQVV